jgi:phage terminase large subunit
LVLGIDYGYTIDPTAIVQVGVEGDKLYVREHMYEKSTDEDMIADRLMASGVDENTPVISETDHTLMRLLKKKSFNIIPADKYPNSVQEGLTLMKKYATYALSEF